MAGRKLSVRQVEVAIPEEESQAAVNIDVLLKKKLLASDEIATLVDIGYEYDAQIKSLSKQVDGIKERLKELASLGDFDTFEGETAEAVISSVTKKEVGFAGLYKFLRSNNKLSLLADLVTVRLQAFEKVFGADTIEEIGKIETIPYARLAFKRKK